MESSGASMLDIARKVYKILKRLDSAAHLKVVCKLEVVCESDCMRTGHVAEGLEVVHGQLHNL